MLLSLYSKPLKTNSVETGKALSGQRPPGRHRDGRRCLSHLHCLWEAYSETPIISSKLVTLVQDIVYDKPKTLDSTFDAGGETSSSLIAVSNMCEFINIQTILGKQSFYLRHWLSISSKYVLSNAIAICYIPSNLLAPKEL